jgi:methane/phenol/toluene hydroxylase
VFLGQVVSESITELDPAKQRWLNDPAFAGARTFVEHLWRDGYDHIEVVFALALIYEPLFGRFARQEYFYRLAPLHGDHLTPQVLWPSLRSAEAANIWTRELFDKILGSDAEFGVYNRQLMAWWAQRWLPRAVDAVADISALFDSTELLRTSQTETPRQLFESLATDWVRDVAPTWGSDVTMENLLGLYDNRSSGRSVG